MIKTAFWTLSCALALLFALPYGSAATQDAPAKKASADRKAVERAVLDYVEGVYEVRPELIERGVHTGLAKLGYYRRTPDEEFTSAAMTFEQLVELAERYNKDGRIGADAPKKVEIYEVLDQTASAKLTAEWGIDYMHLAKIEGDWKIVQVLWQVHPPAQRAR